RDVRGADGDAAARGARPDDRLDGAAPDRLRPRRPVELLLGLHRVHARDDGDGAAVRQARRQVRATALVSLLDLALPRRLRALRAVAEHDRARRLPRATGP